MPTVAFDVIGTLFSLDRPRQALASRGRLRAMLLKILTKTELSWRISDYFPLGVAFSVRAE